MTTDHTPSGLIGASIRRVEDPVLVAGKGCYVDDIRLPEMLYLAFLRTTYPHAKIVSINTNAAKAIAGVLAVITGEDVKQLNIPVAPMVQDQKIPPHPLLALGAVHEAALSLRTLPAPSKSSTKRCPL